MAAEKHFRSVCVVNLCSSLRMNGYGEEDRSYQSCKDDFHGYLRVDLINMLLFQTPLGEVQKFSYLSVPEHPIVAPGMLAVFVRNLFLIDES